jgi:hypothetical protein
MPDSELLAFSVVLRILLVFWLGCAFHQFFGQVLEI